MNRELKRLAQNARNRLISKGENGGMKKQSAPLSPNVKFKVISSAEADESFNAKAREVLLSDDLDPIVHLMDMNYYNSLSDMMKEKYLFDMVDKLARFKAKFDSCQEQKLVY